MDAEKLREIAIVAAMAACGKEIAGWTIRQMPAVTRRVRGSMASSWRRHWRAVPVILDLVVIGISVWWLWVAAWDKSPATREFVALTALMVLLGVWSIGQLPGHLLAWLSRSKSAASEAPEPKPEPESEESES